MNKTDKNQTRRLTAALLCTLLLVTAASGCGGASGETAKESSVPGAETQNSAGDGADTEPAAETGIPLNLPETLDYGGRNVTVLGWDTYEDVEFTTESLNGEVVNDAVFNRNLAVKERLNIELTFLEDGGRSGDNSWMNKLRNANKAGDSAYDITADHSQNIGTLMQSGEFLDLLQYEYLDFAMPWWREELVSRATILGKLYFATGDISPSALARTQGIFFNQKILQEFDLDDPYTLVVNGDWTFEKMVSMTKGVYLDLNADGKANEKYDRFGFAIDKVQTQAIALSAGIITVEADENGYLKIKDDYYSERTSAMLDAWVSFMGDSQDTTFIGNVDDATVFRDGRALFYAFPLGLISSELRDLDFSVGFVPYPKFDAEQKVYTTCTSNAYSLWAIPLSAAEPEMSAAVMECLGYEGFNQITPAIFETAYKVKYNNFDSELQSQVFDLLRANLTFDIGRILSNGATGQIFNLFPDSVNAKKNNIASKYASIEKTTSKKLDAFMEELANGVQ